ncbi:thiamine pyrophosphate-dependent dehydrogenase E1 component subunit alpha [Pseudoclavibacter endophyticus]|uniref:2-oxoisovalerate dehydrogenase subunit alpha n=1 Tax=Pseudoclavibacter endophyticus TaxID=1778590 RepID=A0A6H9WV96_9MICO|nr:thiamine pyrophosphate-dependent dehydrogenase E1 component subunit alpha [Pseudoclavibacter endophyticus]KAB1650434.1 thiamine pyrophosphate-dependent dehydrogenase E1 component subunit alpha [Pseudoclavibacter endophyticus]
MRFDVLDDQTVQILTPDGEVRPNDAARTYLPALDELTLDDYRAAYRDMRLVRAFDNEATNLQRQGHLALYAPLEGQEAAQIGSAYAMRPQDAVFPSYREHGVGLVRGIDLTRVLSVMRGETQGGWDPEETGFRLYTFVIGSQTLQATGYAMGQQFDGATNTGDPERDEATVVYFGDGATSQGDTNEALVFAASNRAPVLFFLQNNQWAISVPSSVQSRTPFAHRAAGFGMPSVRIDGNDVMAAYAASRTHLERIRQGGGPAFIEAMTYRMGAHTTADDPTKYRTSEEEAYWRQRDPIDRLERYLRAQGTGDDFFDAVEQAAKAYALEIRDGTLALQSPPRTVIFEHIYSEPHPLVDEERAWADRYEASFTEEAAQ